MGWEGAGYANGWRLAYITPQPTQRKEQSMKAETKEKSLRIRLKAKEYDAVKAYCDIHGIRMSELVRMLFSRALPPASFYSGSRRQNKSGKLTLRLSPKEFEALSLKAREQGYELETQFVYSLLNSLLFGNALLNNQEVEAANRAVMELSAIGRNLNQIARALNADWNSQGQEGMAEVKAMRRKVLLCKTAVLKMLAAGQRRFHE